MTLRQLEVAYPKELIPELFRKGDKPGFVAIGFMAPQLKRHPDPKWVWAGLIGTTEDVDLRLAWMTERFPHIELGNDGEATWRCNIGYHTPATRLCEWCPKRLRGTTAVCDEHWEHREVLPANAAVAQQVLSRYPWLPTVDRACPRCWDEFAWLVRELPRLVANESKFIVRAL